MGQVLDPARHEAGDSCLRDHAGLPQMVKAAGGAIWSPFHGNLTAEDLKTAQGLGLQVIPWTVNDPADIDRLIGWGVDGIISDYPDRVRVRMAARGMALPPAVPSR